jgi:hypothetical protein
MLRFYSFSIVLFGVGAAAFASDPWPMARADRYGTGKAAGAPTASGPMPWAFRFWQDQVAPVASRNAVISNGSAAHVMTARGPLRFSFNYGSWSTGPAPLLQDVPADWPGAYRAEDDSMTWCVGGAGGGVYRHGDPHYQSNGEKWRRVLGDMAGPPTLGPDGDVYVMTKDGKIFRLASGTGRVVWNRSGFGATTGYPVFLRGDNAIVCVNGNAVRVLSVADGSRIWRRDFTSKPGQPAVAEDGTIVFGNGAGEVYGLDPTTSHTKWQRWFPFSQVVGSPALDGNTVYVATTENDSGSMQVFSIDTSQQRWRARFGTKVEWPPSVGSDGRIYFPVGDKLYAYQTNGILAWVVDARYGIGPVSVGDFGTLFMGTPKGTYGMYQRRFHFQYQSSWVSLGQMQDEFTSRANRFEFRYDDDNALTLPGSRHPNWPNAFVRVEAGSRAFAWPYADAVIRLESKVNHAGTGVRRVHVKGASGPWRLVELRQFENLSDVSEIHVPAAAMTGVTSNGWLYVAVTWQSTDDVSQSSVEIEHIGVSVTPVLWPSNFSWPPTD